MNNTKQVQTFGASPFLKVKRQLNYDKWNLVTVRKMPGVSGRKLSAKKSLHSTNRNNRISIFSFIIV